MLDESYYRKTDEIIARYVREARSLIPIMQDIQAEYRYLPGELLSYVAKEIGITEAKAYSVATFYENFSFQKASSTGVEWRTWQAVPSQTLMTYLPLASKEKFS